ncbi:MAG TPA: Ig-like domain-containing protein [Quisquiliibacterium sp.]|nr:Ig-like domain-containing protein [Quisquiliibacterium sp.]
MHSTRRFLAALAALATSALLAACGGGGESGAGAWGTGSEAGTGVPAALALETNAPSVGSDGRTVATLTAFVKDGGNRAMANQLVDFSTTDAGSVVQVITAQTDASGAATASLRVTDQTNRTVTVTARTGSLSKSLDVAVVGTTLTLNGPSNVVISAPTEFTIGLRDAAGAVLAGKPVAVTSAAGNTLSAATVTTDAAGQARLTFTGTKPGPDTLTVSALGASAAASLQVASSQISFVSPTPGKEIPVATPQQVTVSYLPGQTIQFTSTRGTLSPTEATADAAGNATVTLQSATAGAATITAFAGTLVSSQQVEFVSLVPAKLALQASPANVGVNLSAASTNSSQLIAVVRDAADNPVKGQTVSFSAVSDPSNGRIEPAIATTDSSGVATVAFFPGANSSGFNQIIVKAEVPGKNVAGTTSLTASKQELVVRVGTGNTIEEPSISTYAMPWTAVVTDASGNPVVGATVQASLVATKYYKGTYVAGLTRWNQTVSIGCVSEDINAGPGNGNLRLDAGEDTNGDGQLTPGNVAAAVVTSEGGRTDANGLASIRVSYPQDYGNWVEMQLRVTITTLAGTEGVDQRTFILPISAADLTGAAPPPGTPSPFGVVADCSITD